MVTPKKKILMPVYRGGDKYERIPMDRKRLEKVELRPNQKKKRPRAMDEGGGSRSSKRYRQIANVSKRLNLPFNDFVNYVDREDQKKKDNAYKKYTSPAFGGENTKKSIRYNSLRLAKGSRKPRLPK